MTLRTLYALFLAAWLGGSATSIASPNLLRVMLQGSSADEIATLVTQAGGEVTHDLHIIDAVGAYLTQKQLDEVMESPLITRSINDLANEKPRKPKDDDAKCRVRGHIELDFTAQGIRWPLYNKMEAPEQIQALTMSWPARLGKLKELSIAGKAVDPSLYAATADHTLSVDFAPGKSPVIKDKEYLVATFQSFAAGAAAKAPLQSEFKIAATFRRGCDTKLVPGYANNHDDYYYNTVGGVDALHLQGITGKGVTVAVIDSGLWEHAALINDTSGNNRLIARYDALTDTADVVAQDDSGHGTHMTSIIAHSGPTLKNGKPTGTYKGVAPDANIVAVKVLDREGFAHLLDIVRAVQWVVDNRERYGIRVLNLSFSQDPRWPYWEDPVTQAALVAWRSGVAVVAAAGNDGPEVETIGSPGNLPNLITVGAVTDSWTPGTRLDDYIPDFSARGPTPSGHTKPDIVSLGGHMTGLVPPQSQLATAQPEDTLRTGEFVSTGSSQASAFVSGVLTLLIQLQPNLAPDQLKCIVTSSAEPAIDSGGLLSYSPYTQGAGIFTATRAITLGSKYCSANPDLRGAGQENEYSQYGPAIIGSGGVPILPGMESRIATTKSPEGYSASRRWGVKAHIERLDLARLEKSQLNQLTTHWLREYNWEKEAIERLAQ